MRLSRLLCASAALLVSVGTGSVVAQEPPAPAATVVIENTAYNPNAVTIQLGQSVRWNNADDTRHTVTAVDESFDSDRGCPEANTCIAPNHAFQVTFERAGTFEYFCKVHPQQMRGTVQVQGGTTTTPTTAPPTTGTPTTATTATTAAATTTVAGGTTTTAVEEDATTTTRRTTTTVGDEIVIDVEDDDDDDVGPLGAVALAGLLGAGGWTAVAARRAWMAG